MNSQPRYRHPDMLAIAFGAGLMLLLVRLSRSFEDVYFAYSQFVYGYSAPSISALALRFLIPFVAGALLTLARGAGKAEATIAALLASIFLVWGPVMDPETYLDAELYHRRYTLYLVYVVFSVAFTFVCRTGAELGPWLWERLGRAVTTEKSRASETIRDLVIGLLTSALYAGLSRMWTESPSAY